MPWNFGVWREDGNRLDRQEALYETTTLTGPEVWQKIWNHPNAKDLYKRIMTHGRAGAASGEPNSFFHQVLSTSQINTGMQSMVSPVPGGIVQLNNDPNYSIMGPQVGPPVVTFRELWAKDEDDYTTIQLIEPDIIVTPYQRRKDFVQEGQSHRQWQSASAVPADSAEHHPRLVLGTFRTCRFDRAAGAAVDVVRRSSPHVRRSSRQDPVLLPGTTRSPTRSMGRCGWPVTAISGRGPM